MDFNIQINMYADDAQLYVAFNLNEKDQTKLNILECLSTIKSWMDNNFLKINTEKTQIKLFKPDKLNLNYDLNFNGNLLECQDEINILGVNLTKNLDMKKFIQRKVQVCNFKLRNLVFIKNSIPFKIRITLVTNLILSNLDYCNSLLACSNENTLKPLRLVLNRAVRFIFNISKRTHITYFLKRLHFLPVKFRIIFKTCLLAFKIFHQMAPEYLQSKFSKFVRTTTSNLRDNSGRDNYMFHTTLEDHRRNTLINQIKINWNSLPLQIRQFQRHQLIQFKTKLKTHLFQIAYELS